jgi:hypothetical protein
LPETIELADLIDYIAEQLLEAEARGAKRSERVLELGDVELELTVAFEKKAGAGIKIYVIDLGGGVASSHTHRIKTTFKPAGLTVFETDDGRGSSGDVEYPDEDET